MFFFFFSIVKGKIYLAGVTSIIKKLLDIQKELKTSLSLSSCKKGPPLISGAEGPPVHVDYIEEYAKESQIKWFAAPSEGQCINGRGGGEYPSRSD